MVSSGLHGALFALTIFALSHNCVLLLFKDSEQKHGLTCDNLQFATFDKDVVSKWQKLDLILSTFCTQPVNNKKVTTANSYTKRVNRNTLYIVLTLLLSGDLELNPGPTKDPCGICSKCIRVNQKCIACDTCNTWFHITCINMDLSTFNQHTRDQSLPFHCVNCTVPHATQSGQTTDPDPAPTAPHAVPGSQPEIDLWKTVKGIKIAHVNTGEGGLILHIDEVHNLLVDYNPDILACSETWLEDDYDKGPIETDMYAFYSRQKPADMQGEQGVGFFIKRSLDSTERPEFDHPHIMNCTIEIRRNKSKPIILSCIYRHYSTRVNWYSDLEDLLGNLDNSGLGCILTGDFNNDVLKPTE